MATSWVLGKISGALAPTVSSTVSTVGGFAGGAVSTVGNSINGVGEGLNSSIRRYGDGAKDYGNSIKDWSKADAVRSSTASNPLGLTGDTSTGKRSVTSPTVYNAPVTKKPDPSKTLTTTKKTVDQAKSTATSTKPKTASVVKPQVGTSVKKPSTAGSTPGTQNKVAAVKAQSKPNLGATKKPAAAVGKVAGAGSSITKSVKPSTATATATKVTNKPASTQKPKGNQASAANPLGLTLG